MEDFIIKNGVLMKYQGQGGNVVIPEGVEIIGWNAFKNCKTLTSVTFPESLQIIKEKAFHGCSHLSELVLDKNINLVEEEAFSWCSGLKKLTVGKNVQELQKKAFSYCYSLKELIFCNDEIKIESSTFQLCQEVEKVQLLDVVFDLCALAEKYQKELTNFISLAKTYMPRGILLSYFFSVLFQHHPRKQFIPSIFDEYFLTMLKRNPANPNLTENMIEQTSIPFFQKIVKEFIQEEIFTQDNIDIYIQIAIENHLYELQLILTNYKYQHFDFQNPADKLKL